MKTASLPRRQAKRPLKSVNQTAIATSKENEFVSAVSHELRTPLTSIRGALALIMSGAAGELPGKAKELLAVALRNSERLILIVNDILDAEKIETGNMCVKMQKIQLAPFLQETLVYNESYAEKFKVRFRLEPVSGDAEVVADPHRLMQVITNLLSNAAKFSPSGSEVTVHAREDGKKMIIEVQDRGSGIPKDFQPHVFKKFAQAVTEDGSSREGAGLGLNLSRRMIELMGGEIGFKTRIGKGTTFFIHLQTGAEPACRTEVA